MKWKKMIAPSFIFVLVLLYMLFILVPITKDPFINYPFKIVMSIILIILIIIFVKVFFERIKEIKEGKEDDLSKY